MTLIKEKCDYIAGEVVPAAGLEEYPLTQGQAALWFHYRLAPQSVAYNLAGAAAVPAGTNLDALECAFRKLAARHPTLRTLFFELHGEPAQRVYPSLPIDFRRIDGSKWDAARLDSHLAKEIYRPFDLEQGPAWRVVVFQRAPLIGKVKKNKTRDEHLVLLVLHHMIADMWSMAILMSELAAFYKQETTATPAGLRPLKFSFADYDLEEQKRLTGPQADQSLEYWKTILTGELPPLNLQTDHPRPMEFTGRGFAQGILVNEQLTCKLRDLAAEKHVPLYTILLTAFQTLLHRYTGQNEILVGFPKARRSSSTARLVGYFINQVVVPARFGDNPNFYDLLARVDQSLKDSRPHDWYPFPQLVQHLQPERVPNRSPLIQAVFSWQQAPGLIPKQSSSQFILREAGNAVDLGGLVMRPVNLPYRVAPFELTMLAAEVSDGISITIEYAADLYDPPTITHMIARYQTLLESITADPGSPVSRLKLLPEDERKTLVEGWNATRAPYPSGLCLHQLFEQQVESTPELMAVRSGGAQMTYRQLNQQANQLAHILQRQGIGPQSVVGIYMEPSVQMIKAILGILKAGGAYLPLDINNPMERLRFMLSDARPEMLITGREVQGNLPEFPGSIFIIDEAEDFLADQSQNNPPSNVSPDHPAYIIYTSGSTGQPKGAILAHRGVINLLSDFQRRQSILPGDACSWWTSPSFDVSVYEIFSPLLAGGCLHVIPENIRLDVPRFCEWLQENRIRSAFLPAFFLEDFLTWIRGHPGGSSLRRLLVGVEPIPYVLLASIHALLPDLTIINGYGPTEATICSTLFMVDSSSPLPGNVPIGRPVTNTQVYLLDQDLQPVPIGLVGEVYLGGVGLAHGYLNHPDLTAQRFIKSPFRIGERLYQTGDLARYLPDGNLLFAGRADTQIKLHGMRIELGEIEANLVQYPGVKQAVVKLHQSTPGGKHLVAYLTASLNSIPSSEELRVYLSQRLPASMVPSYFTFLDAFPLTTTGKVDRKALPTPELFQEKQSITFEAPQTRVEQILASIWERVLGVDHIGRSDNFFKLGGDSILSLQVVALASEAGLQLKPHHIFQAPKLAELAALAAPAIPDDQSPQPTIARGEIPLTPIQHWFFQQDFINLHHWNQSLLFIPSRVLDPTNLRLALSALLQQHDALRLRYEKDASGWHQTLPVSAEQIPFEVIDVSGLAGPQQETFIEEQVAIKQASLNLSTGPMLRVVYFNFGEKSPGRLLIVIHHLVVDAVSWRILVDDLQKAYLQLESGQPIRLPAKTTAFHTWARRLAEYARSTEITKEADFWQHMVEMCKRYSLDHPIISEDEKKPRDMEVSTQRVSNSLDKAETQALFRQAPTAYGTKLDDFILTALVRAFQHWSNKGGIWINLEAHGREEIFSDIDLSRTVGWFTTLYPVCLELPFQSSLDQSIKSIIEQLHRIPRHGLGYGLLRYLSHDRKIKQRFNGFTAAPVSFNYLGQLLDRVDGDLLSGLVPESPRDQRSPAAQRPHAIEINAALYQGEFTIEWIYNASLHYRYPIDQLADYFMAELRALIAHCLSVNEIGHTPSDFPEVDLRQTELDSIFCMYSKPNGAGSRHHIEAIYPLSPMQQGMIFHSLYTPESGIYFIQTSCTIEGHIEVDILKRAWQSVIERHPILRTSFVWQGLDRVLQVVHRSVKAPITLKDWRELPASQQQKHYTHFLADERKRGFNLADPPLLRLDLLQTNDDKYTLVLNYHHALLDGWSISLLFEQVFGVYNSIVQNERPVVPPAIPYQEYLSWVHSQDLASAESFWRNELEGYVPIGLSSVGASSPLTGASQPVEQDASLSIQSTRALNELARQHNLTLSTLLQGAWALLLSMLLHRQDVLFGVTVSGRSADFSGALRMIGLLINTLPFRVHITPEIQLSDWLQYIQSKTLEIQKFDYSPLAQIQNWSGLPRSTPLFDTLFVFENYPASFRSDGKLDSLKFTSIHSIEQSTYPLTLAVTPDQQLEFRLLYDPDIFESKTIRDILGHLIDLLKGMLSNSNQSLSQLYQYIDLVSDESEEEKANKDKTNPLEIHRLPVSEYDEMHLPSEAMLDQEGLDTPPSSPLEEYLATRWKKLLEIERVSTNHNFFHLGGDSLRAAICTYQLQNVINEKIPLTAIFENPTIHQYARYLEQNYPAGVAHLLGTPTLVHKPSIKDSPAASLVPIQPGGTKSPLFCIHPAGGIVFPYYALSAFLDKDQPLYGVQDPALYNTAEDPVSIDAMASRYIMEIRTIQPGGPYQLLGWSAGGVIAYEMAQQLSKQGLRVARLIIIDTAAPPSDKISHFKNKTKPLLLQLLTWIWAFPDQFRELPTVVSSIFGYIRSGLYLLIAASKKIGAPSDENPRIGSLFGWIGLDTWRALLLRGDGEIASTVSQETSLLLIQMPDIRRILKLVQVHRRLARRFKANVYHGNITLFRAIAPGSVQENSSEPTLGWAAIASGGVDIHNIQANHVGLFVKPHIEALAQELKAILNDKP